MMLEEKLDVPQLKMCLINLLACVSIFLQLILIGNYVGLLATSVMFY